MLLLKQGHLEPVAQGHVQTDFEYLQGWRLCSLSGQPVPVLSHLHSEKVFPSVQREPPVFHFVPGGTLPLVLSLSTAEKSLAPSSFHPPSRYLYTLTSSLPEPSLLQAEQSQLCQPFLICGVLQSLPNLCGSCWTLSMSLLH